MEISPLFKTVFSGPVDNSHSAFCIQYRIMDKWMVLSICLFVVLPHKANTDSSGDEFVIQKFCDLFDVSRSRYDLSANHHYYSIIHSGWFLYLFTILSASLHTLTCYCIHTFHRSAVNLSIDYSNKKLLCLSQSTTSISHKRYAVYVYYVYNNYICN